MFSEKKIILKDNDSKEYVDENTSEKIALLTYTLDKELVQLENKKEKDVRFLQNKFQDLMVNENIKLDEFLTKKNQLINKIKEQKGKTSKENSILKLRYDNEIKKIKEEKPKKRRVMSLSKFENERLAGPPILKKDYFCDKNFQIVLKDDNEPNNIVILDCSVKDKISKIIERYKQRMNYPANMNIILAYENQILEPNLIIEEANLYPSCTLKVIPQN